MCPVKEQELQGSCLIRKEGWSPHSRQILAVGSQVLRCSTGSPLVRSGSEALARSRAKNRRRTHRACPAVYDQFVCPCADQKPRQNARPIVECLRGAHAKVAAPQEIRLIGSTDHRGTLSSRPSPLDFDALPPPSGHLCDASGHFPDARTPALGGPAA